MAIEVIVFDLGKVIFDFDLNILCDNLSKYSSDKEPFKNINSFMYSHDDLFFNYETGKISSDFIFSELKKYLKLDISFNEFKTAWNDIFAPIQGTMDIISAVSKKYKTAILSNTNELHFEFVKESYPEFFKQFNKFFVSHEMELRKPDPEIYQQIIKYYNIKPEQMFFTDDMKINVEAAQKLGIKAYVFESSEKLKKDLTEEGVVLC